MIYNGISLEKRREYDPDLINRSRNSLSVKNGQFVIGTVNRLVKDKGIEYLLEAMALLSISRDDIVCLIVGDGDQKKKLEEMSRSLNISDKVIFAGNVEDVSRYISVMDIFIQPSLHETFGLSVAEALLDGRPVIVTSVCGICELLEDGHNAVFIPPKDPLAISNAVKDLITDKDLSLIHI